MISRNEYLEAISKLYAIKRAEELLHILDDCDTSFSDHIKSMVANGSCKCMDCTQLGHIVRQYEIQRVKSMTVVSNR